MQKHSILFFYAFHTFVLDKYVYYCKPSNPTNLFAEAWLEEVFIKIYIKTSCNQASANKLVCLTVYHNKHTWFYC